LGIIDPNQLPSGNISGKALAGQQNQVDLSEFPLLRQPDPQHSAHWQADFGLDPQDLRHSAG
jgi:hypothetical protein